MSEMVQRVEAVLREKLRLVRDHGPPPTLADIARAAIAAMREPTEGMVSLSRSQKPYDRDCAETWPEMIDEALR